MRRLVFLIFLLVLLIYPASADDAIQVYPPFTIPNQIVLENPPETVYIVVFVGTYTQGSDYVNPINSTIDSITTKTYTVLDPHGNAIASGTLTFNESLSAYYVAISPTIFDEPGAWRINVTIQADINNDTVTEIGTAESVLKVIHNKGSYLLLSQNGINELKLTDGVLTVKSVTNTSLTLVNSVTRQEINLTPGRSISISIVGFPATLILDRIETIDGENYAVVTVTYPNYLISYTDFVDIPEDLADTNFLADSSLIDQIKRKVRHSDYKPIIALSGGSNTFRDTLEKNDDAIEFTQLLESHLFGLIQKFQEFRIEPPEGDIEWYVKIRAGISFSNWIAAGCPLDINEALDALLVWESEPHVEVNWKAEKWKQIFIFARKLAERAEKGVELITNSMIEPHWEDLGFKGGFWTKLFAEHSDEAVSAFVIAADWSISDVQGIQFNWDEMWNALLNGEIIVSMNFIIDKVTLEFRV